MGFASERQQPRTWEPGTWPRHERGKTMRNVSIGLWSGKVGTWKTWNPQILCTMEKLRILESGTLKTREEKHAGKLGIGVPP